MPDSSPSFALAYRKGFNLFSTEFGGGQQFSRYVFMQENVITDLFFFSIFDFFPSLGAVTF